MAVLLPAAMAHAERAGGVSGRDFLTAIVLGVDVGASLGIASRSGLRFFRPATAGGFAATAAVGRLMGFDAATLVNAFGALLGQLSGTMQAHAEGSPLLALQVGFNARNALVACDLAAQGLPGPQEVLEGPFGYFALFEGAHDLAPVLAQLGARWRVGEVALKPFPTGRATHGVLDGVLALQQEHGFGADDVQSVVCTVPPLTARLVGRPAPPGHEPQPGPPQRSLRACLRAAGRRGRRRRLHRRGARRSRPSRARGADRGAGRRQSRCQCAHPGRGRGAACQWRSRRDPGRGGLRQPGAADGARGAPRQVPPQLDLRRRAVGRARGRSS